MLKVNEWNLEQSSSLHCHHQIKQIEISTKYFQYIEKFSIAKCPITHDDPYIKCNLKQNTNVSSVLENGITKENNQHNIKG